MLAGVIRLAYVLTDERTIIGSDGFAFHAVAVRMADGLGYTFALKGGGQLFSQHPPAWPALLAGFSWLGARSQFAHQLVGGGVGLCVVVVTGVVGRRYFDERVGLVAATIAALYPGFWVLEGNLLSEPLAVLVLGLLTLAVAEVRDHPRIGWSILAGALCGLLALVRSEALTLVVIIVAPVILLTRTVSFRQRLRLLAGAALACLVVVAPWAAFLSIYYERPVLLSTNAGYLLLSTNCPPSTYEGRLIGYYDPQMPARVRASGTPPRTRPRSMRSRCGRRPTTCARTSTASRPPPRPDSDASSGCSGPHRRCAWTPPG